MAGGMWLVAGAGATVGALGGSTSAMFYELGAAETRAELVKLQVTFRVAVLGVQNGQLKAQEILKQLGAQKDAIGKQLDKERLLNDKNSERVKDLDEKLHNLIIAMEWMKEQKEKDEERSHAG